MRAVRVDGPDDVRMVEVPTPRAVDDEVLVQVVRAAMCATDVKLVARGADPPRVPGHEVAGRLDGGRLVGVHPTLGAADAAFAVPASRIGVQTAFRSGWTAMVGSPRWFRFRNVTPCPSIWMWISRL